MNINFASEYSELWNLSPEVIYLNHGSFGACPKEVLKYQSEIRLNLEEQPMSFFLRKADELLYNSKVILAEFISAEAENIVFVPNVTNGVSTVLNSLKLNNNDHILITNHIYFACRNAIEHFAKKSGVIIDIAEVNFPDSSDDNCIEAILDKVNSKTRIALIDHITSPTGIIFPVKEVVRQLNTKNIDVIIDGAHAPGMIPLNIKEIGAAYYTGNCHKWICSPKGVGFLYVRTDKQKDIFPPVISHLQGDGFTALSDFQYKFSWAGTHDISAYISVGKSLKYMAGLFAGGWKDIMHTNRTLALKAREILCSALKIDSPCPANMIGSLASIPLPDDEQKFNFKSFYLEPVYKRLAEEYNIEVLTCIWQKYPKRLLRISAQLYNSEKQYEILGEALKKILS